MILSLGHVVSVSCILFILGLIGMLSGRRNIITLLMSLELMLLAVNLNLIGFSTFHQELTGHIFTFFILTVAAAEAAIGLAILVVYQRQRHSIDVDNMNSMRG